MISAKNTHPKVKGGRGERMDGGMDRSDANRNRAKKKNYYRYLKRGMDLFFSAVLLLLLWLPMAAIGALICLESSGGALFRQKRVGRDGKLFTCYKFRTMYKEAPRDLSTAEFTEAERYITHIGRFLRRTSMDELPQLWNVLRGDMSLVGPRPLIPKEQTVHELRKRNGVYQIRPGMTGLAQINGRDLLKDSEKASFDIQYAGSMSLREDCKIIFRTLTGGFSGEGITK